ncbi:MAG: agmatine deiminase family protein [Cytophagia bacterium]|nr:MAG: agmatine deiminase family protein [Runella sp.]TAG21798.1 MAG: agmatine deiminase family protein [Cytophagales bacterium]TAG41038.1 MAG: agmatine deiminase family protein [Cytophagia bacterium]TAG60084.1 MAG: agmatine deiminase family protein [Runella slithyformis]TAG83831.1 MAG: agmatine deiminase family protein [Cytophagales bacterium]
MTSDFSQTPQQRGFVFPPEWHPHRATWLSFPHTEASWSRQRQELMLPAYLEFIKTISEGEKVCINAHNEIVRQTIEMRLLMAGVDMAQIELPLHATNDSWCRDHGPGILINTTTKERLVVNWGYNAWGNKYPPYDRDDLIPVAIANYLGLEHVTPGIVMEGGSVEFNGAGTVLTSRACLLNQNRNPHLSQAQIEQYLCHYYGVEQVLWIEDGIVGDDTDGHIDDTVRFVNADTVLAIVEENKADENYPILQHNLQEIKQMRLLNGKQLNIVELPMPAPVVSDGLRLPASYANFYISNAAVIVPTFRCANDQRALDIIAACFPDRKTVGIDSTEVVWGLGSFHCLSQQEPLV